MAKINFKIADDWKTMILIATVVFVFLSGAMWFTNRPQGFIAQAEPRPSVRDEFIDKLVEGATDGYGLVKVGRQYYEQGELDRAQKLFKQASQIEPKYRDSFYHLGLAEFELGNTDRALYAFLRAKTLDPIYKPTYEMLTKIYEQKGDKIKAKETATRGAAL